MPSVAHRLLAAGLLLGAPRPALAQVAPSPAPAPAPAPAPSPAPDSDAKARARAFVDAGLQAHERGDYDAALALYQQAYDLLPHPALFFNMGQAHRLAGRPADALAMYRRYLAEVPTGPLADQTRVWIAALESAAEPTPGPPPAPSPSPSPSPIAAPPRPPPTRRSPGWTYAALGAATSGVATAAVAGWFGLRAQRLSDELSQPGPFDQVKYDAGQRAEDTMFVLYGIGGALVVGGAALFLLAPEQPVDEGRLSLTPVLAADRAGLTLSGHF
jgi:tetratricopeptide (TPR) repeat protein